jgi:chromosome segregation ATPase
MDVSQLDGRKAFIEEAIDSGEFFLSSLRERISQLKSRRDGLKSVLTSLESEERLLKIQQNKIQGALLSQDLRHGQEVDSLRSAFESAEELLWASRMEKDDKCKKLEMELEGMRRKRALVQRPSKS